MKEKKVSAKMKSSEDKKLRSWPKRKLRRKPKREKSSRKKVKKKRRFWILPLTMRIDQAWFTNSKSHQKHIHIHINSMSNQQSLNSSKNTPPLPKKVFSLKRRHRSQEESLISVVRERILYFMML